MAEYHTQQSAEANQAALPTCKHSCAHTYCTSSVCTNTHTLQPHTHVHMQQFQRAALLPPCPKQWLQQELMLKRAPTGTIVFNNAEGGLWEDLVTGSLDMQIMLGSRVKLSGHTHGCCPRVQADGCCPRVQADGCCPRVQADGCVHTHMCTLHVHCVQRHIHRYTRKHTPLLP